MFSDIADLAVSLLFPIACSVCTNPVKALSDGPACEECWTKTRLFGSEDALCAKCGLALNSASPRDASICSQCTDLVFQKAVAAGEYDNALRAVVLRLKREPTVPKRLIAPIGDALDRLGPRRPDLIIPVPLAAARRHERGFNQAEIISEAVSKISGLPIDRSSLARRVHTPLHRAGMDRKARELSVKKAFVVRRPKLVEGRRILLVDDVLTSGATASNCAGALLDSGAAEVSVFTLARAVRVS